MHMLAEPLLVCDTCALPRGIAFLSSWKNQDLKWGLYILQLAADMPRVCVTASCGSIIYQKACRKCGMPTVPTMPHETRNIHVNAQTMVKAKNTLQYLEDRESVERGATVGKYTAEDSERLFRACFPRFQDVFAFTALSTASEAQEFLLSVVCAEVAYAYGMAPNITLSLNYAPYSCLLKLVRHNQHFSLFEAPGKLLFISFPGTHDQRTFAVSLHFGLTKYEDSSRPVDDPTAPLGENGEYQNPSGGIPKTAESCVHEGFAGEARKSAFQIEELVKDAINDGYRLIFSGHSLGGAVAQLVALHMLRAHPGVLTERLRCFSIGAPLVGNYQLTQYIEGCGWRSNFHSIVYGSDVVPRLLCADIYIRSLRGQFGRMLTTLGSSLQKWITFSSGPKGDLENTTAPRDDQIRDWKDCFESKDTLLSKNEIQTQDMYACFGRYHFLNYGETKYFSTDDPEVVLRRLKEGCGRKFSLQDHSMSSYNQAIFLHLYSV